MTEATMTYDEVLGHLLDMTGRRVQVIVKATDVSHMSGQVAQILGNLVQAHPSEHLLEGMNEMTRSTGVGPEVEPHTDWVTFDVQEGRFVPGKTQAQFQLSKSHFTGAVWLEELAILVVQQGPITVKISDHQRTCEAMGIDPDLF